MENTGCIYFLNGEILCIRQMTDNPPEHWDYCYTNYGFLHVWYIPGKMVPYTSISDDEVPEELKLLVMLVHP